MSYQDVRRKTVSATLIGQFATSRGLTMDAVLRDTGLTPALLADTQAEISAAQELRLIRNVAEGLGHPPGLGLELGVRYHLAAYGIWGFALASSPDLLSAAQLAVRYLDLSYAFVRFRLEQRPPHIALVLDDSGLPDDLRDVLFERDFAAWGNATEEMRPGGLPLLEAHFRGPPPPHAERYAQLCRCPIHFGAEENVFLIDPETLRVPLPQSDERLSRLCQEQCRQLLASRQTRSGYAEKVRDRLLQSPATMPGIGEVAAGLCMAPRTLRRRLDAEQTSFSELLEEVRRSLAEEMLRAGHIKLSEIAVRLGYAEAASFIHAFKRWKGVSPAVYRRQTMAAGDVFDNCH